MTDNRLHVRLGETYHAWLASLGTAESDAARALLVVGAAALRLPGVEEEALRLLLARPQLNASTLRALLEVSDIRRTGVGQASDAEPVPTLENQGITTDDPFASLGFDV